jgi:hypothetical protein
LAGEKHEESFRVVDRRLFNAEGELRPEAVDEERREEEHQARVNNQKDAAPPPSATPAPQSPTGEATVPQATPPSRSFQMLVDLLARNAALFLGGYTDPSTGRAILDLEGAREIIDMIEVLREKTRGNLATEDDRFLTEVLGGLKLSFLEVSKAAAQAMREGGPAANPLKSRSKS